WTRRSLRRRFETVRAPLGATKQAATRLGGTLNTALLTATADAAGAYHRELGDPVEQLRASMVISTRRADSGANAFTFARLLVPTGEMSVAERFGTIADATTKAREGSASASVETLAVVASALPTSLLTRLVRQQAQTVDFATSNVRGAPVPMFIGGAKVLQNYPLGPLSGVAFNLTLLSYMDSMDMGVNIDRAAVEQPAKLRAHLNAAFKRLRSR
ncbi:MAG: WSD1 family O-acyltransferase, partial [Actinomycetota bacterium]|nr:WSD1 family O-acyltransferase [Actinomycetota bacterium]